MSIDFTAVLHQNLGVAAYCDAVQATLDRLIGPGHTLEVEFWPSWDDVGSRPPMDPSTFLMGVGQPDRWLTFSLEPHVCVSAVASSGLETDGAPELIASAERRTASSVVVAIACVVAAMQLGEGRYESVIELTDGGEPTAETIVGSLCLLEPPADLEEAARDLLLAVPSFASWGVLRTEAGG